MGPERQKYRAKTSFRAKKVRAKMSGPKRHGFRNLESSILNQIRKILKSNRNLESKHSASIVCAQKPIITKIAMVPS